MQTYISIFKGVLQIWQLLKLRFMISVFGVSTWDQVTREDKEYAMTTMGKLIVGLIVGLAIAISTFARGGWPAIWSLFTPGIYYAAAALGVFFTLIMGLAAWVAVEERWKRH